MKKNIKKYISIIIFLLIANCFIIHNVFAQEIKFIPQISIGTFSANEPVLVNEFTFANYIVAFYQWSVRAIAILAVIMIMIAGFRWITSAGNAPAISQAKDQMISAIIGLVLALGANLFLYSINPNLVKFRPIKPTVISTMYLKQYCKDLPEDKKPKPAEWGDLSTGKITTGYLCGQSYPIPLTEEEKKEGLKQQYCFGDKCTSDPNKVFCDLNIGDGVCVDPKAYCCGAGGDRTLCIARSQEIADLGARCDGGQNKGQACTWPPHCEKNPQRICLKNDDCLSGEGPCTNTSECPDGKCLAPACGWTKWWGVGGEIGGADSCQFSAAAVCNPGEIQVKCSEGGDECWDSGTQQPKYKDKWRGVEGHCTGFPIIFGQIFRTPCGGACGSAAGIKAFCVNPGVHANAASDSICCQDKNGKYHLR